jgi:hypothetical protein
MMILNFEEWNEVVKKPDWYKFVYIKLLELQELKLNDVDAYENNKEKVYDFFEEHLKIGDIYLGKTGKNWDLERKPIDTIIIHHTSNQPGISTVRLSAIELFRLYCSTYANAKPNDDIFNQPIYSHHFNDGQQVFWAYHWLVKQDGTCLRLLSDNETGWQSGNWDINCRSAAIVFDNDFENSKPSIKEMETVAEIIKTKYPAVNKNRIFGHREINPKTACPSNLFLSSDTTRGWKEELLDLI